MIAYFKNKITSNLFAFEWWSILFNPFHITRRKLFLALSENQSEVRGNLLDFGCGSKPYQKLFSVLSYSGCDIEKSGHDHSKESIDFFYDGKSIPKPSGSFDSLISSEVLEHIFNPDQILAELNRVLKSGSPALFTCPFFWGEHETPFDFCRYSSFGLVALLERNGFRVEKQLKLGNRFSVFFQLCNLMIYDALRFNSKAWILGFPAFGFFNLLDGVFGSLYSKDSIYLSTLVLAVAKK